MTILNILVIEDQTSDFLLLQRRLLQDGLACQCRQVDSMETLEQALGERAWDVALSDYNVPGLAFDDIFHRLKSYNRQLPVILVSGTVGEELAVDMLKKGVSDFVLKDRSARLKNAIERALNEAGAQRTLREHEIWMSRIFNSMPQTLLVVDAEGHITRCNDQTLPMFGYTSEELMGQSVEILVPDWLRHKHVVSRQNFQVRPETRNMGFGKDLFARHKNGQGVPIEVSLTPLHTEGTVQIIVTIQDISERKKAERALRLSEERLRLMTDSIKDYAIVMLDITGRIVTWNEGAKRVKGYEEDEIIGESFERFYEASAIAEGKPRQLLRQAEESGSSKDEGWRVRRDGSLFFADVVINAIRDEAGHLLGFVKVTQDITERRQAELLIREDWEQQATLRELLEIASSGKALEETLKLCLERLLAVSWLALLPKGGIFLMGGDGKALRLVITHDLSPQIRRECAHLPLGRCLCGQAANTRQMQFAKCVDSRHEISYPGMTDHGHYSVPLMFDDAVLGVLVLYLPVGFKREPRKEQFIVSVADILAGYIQQSRIRTALYEHQANLEEMVTRRTAELDRARIEAERLARVKDNFLATMSHEIRTPMNALLGMLELVGLHGLSKEQSRMLDVARDSGKSLLRIIDDILDYSKIEAGKLSIEPEPASVQEIIELTANFYQGLASGKGLALKYSVSPDISPAILVDRLRLRQILNNFISNAIKFTERGQIELKAELVEHLDGAEKVSFIVTDTGVGISPEAQASLFQPFNQADSETTRKYGGTGLGLAICRRLAEMMGGGIALHSEEGTGTTLRLTLELPVISPEELKAAKPAQPTSAATFSRRVTPPIEEARESGTLILLVDDHSTNREVLTQQLSLLGYASEQATTSFEALQMWRDQTYGLLITDCHMPDMDGYQLSREIRRIESETNRPRIPILGWTANALRDAEVECMSAGMDDILVKPADLMSLETKLKKLMPVKAASNVQGVISIGIAYNDSEHTRAVNDEFLDSAVLAELTGGNKAMEAKMLKRFMASNQVDAKSLVAAFEEHDAVSLSRLAHRIKGASRMIGARHYSTICETLEQAGRNQDWPKIVEYFEEFKPAYEKLTGLLEKA